jgi:hypothetical protein
MKCVPGQYRPSARRISSSNFKKYDYEEDDDRPKRSSFICQRREINKYYIPVN